MDGRRFLLIPLLALALLLPSVTNAADSPATRWPVGGSTLRTALWMGSEHWGMTPCRGRVVMSWDALGSATNAQSSWANDVDPYLQPSFNTDCEIALSLQVDWDWQKLCTVVVHEVGHLTGHDHIDDMDDVMYATYVEPVAECLTTPAPLETGAPAPAPKKRAAAATKKKRAAAKKRAAKPRRR
ncbi:matrixin family metalloprotease [Baekduia sp. Peel2402]|uniref:matrixin family metalloprotease n=1 Tax=Baekduia sp. Peel2402 TaxID=3458296 RepID=UPI00403EC2B6